MLEDPGSQRNCQARYSEGLEALGLCYKFTPSKAKLEYRWLYLGLIFHDCCWINLIGSGFNL